MKCADCGSTEIKSRTNYSHGKKSGGSTSYQCKKCGSSKVTVERSFGYGGRGGNNRGGSRGGFRPRR